MDHTKVGQFEFSQVADEQVLRLQVSVEDPPAVDVAETSQQLEHEDLQQDKQTGGVHVELRPNVRVD